MAESDLAKTAAGEMQSLLDALDQAYDAAAIAQGRLRLARVYAGQPVDCLPILVDSPAHDVTNQTSLRVQFYSAEAMLVEHLRRLVRAARIPDDGQLCIRANLGVVLVPSLFGLVPEVPDDAMPRFRGHLSKDEVSRVGLPEDVACGDLVARALRYTHYFQEVLGDRVHVYVPDNQGVFDIAHLVLGDALFLAMYDDPAFVHHLLELSLEAYLHVTRVIKDVLGEPLDRGYHGHGMVSGIYLSDGGTRISEDTPTLLRPAHIDAFVMPYVVRSLDPFGGGFVHYCGCNDHLFRALLETDLVRGINLGNPEKHDSQRFMRSVLDHGKFYFGSWPRLKGELLKDYLQRVLDLLDGARTGLIFLLTPAELGKDSPVEAVDLWRQLQSSG